MHLFIFLWAFQLVFSILGIFSMLSWLPFRPSSSSVVSPTEVYQTACHDNTIIEMETVYTSERVVPTCQIARCHKVQDTIPIFTLLNKWLWRDFVSYCTSVRRFLLTAIKMPVCLRKRFLVIWIWYMNHYWKYLLLQDVLVCIFRQIIMGNIWDLRWVSRRIWYQY